MLSICIPIYNHNVNSLIEELLTQCLKLKIKFEILAFENGSLIEYQKLNQNLHWFNEVNYRVLDIGISRSAIRNLLWKTARYEYVLFLDCDMQIDRNSFIENYLQSKSKADVVCGGIKYVNTLPSKNVRLRWRYGVTRETIPAHIRQMQAYNSFMTGSFMARKDIEITLKFNEEIIDYGHEDTLFGIELKRKGLSVIHIDNTCIHNGLESNQIFVEKTETGLRNLHRLAEHPNFGNDIIKHVRIARTYAGFGKPIKNMLIIASKLLLKPLRHYLIVWGKCIFVFDVYKLLYYGSLK